MLGRVFEASRRAAQGGLRRGFCAKAPGGGGSAALVGGAAVVGGGAYYAYSQGYFEADPLPRGMARTGDSAFDAWVRTMAFASPPDPKDTLDFKYITFTERPPFTAKHTSLLAKHLTEELWAKLKDVKTSGGYTFSNAIQGGVMLPGLNIGLTMGDEESFEAFKDILFPCIKDWHGFDPSKHKHKSDLSAKRLKVSKEQAALFDKYVISSRMRSFRNISGFTLPPGSTAEDRVKVEAILSKAFEGLDGELKGKYTPIKAVELSKQDEEQIQAFGIFDGEVRASLFSMEGKSRRDEHVLQSQGYFFQRPRPTQVLGAAGAARGWPEGRGIFQSDTGTAVAWFNEEDHCRLISIQKGGDLPGVFERYAKLSDTVEAAAKSAGTKVMYNDKLGYLGSLTSNLGTGLRASMLVQLPKLNKYPDQIKEVCKEFNLEPRGSTGVNTTVVDAIWDISNKQRLGLSEVELAQKVIDGVAKMIRIEEKLAGGVPIDAALKAAK